MTQLSNKAGGKHVDFNPHRWSLKLASTLLEAVRRSPSIIVTMTPLLDSVRRSPSIIVTMAPLYAAILFLSILGKEKSFVLGGIATATSYDPPYTPTQCGGSRLDQFPPGNLFAKVSEGLWDNGAACGRRYRLRCLSGNNEPCKETATVDIKVVDFCSARPCPATVVMSNDAFSAISRSQDAKIYIEYIEI